jgi:hypothetical protein
MKKEVSSLGNSYKGSFLLFFAMSFFFIITSFVSYLMTSSNDLFMNIFVGGIAISIICLISSLFYVWQYKQ